MRKRERERERAQNGVCGRERKRKRKRENTAHFRSKVDEFVPQDPCVNLEIVSQPGELRVESTGDITANDVYCEVNKVVNGRV